MKKAELMKEKFFAEQQNDHTKANKLGEEIDRLEAEAKELESQRTVHIKSISYINERNRNKNILDGSLCNSSGGHQAIQDDPFTRRRCAPQIYTKKQHDTPGATNGVEPPKEEEVEEPAVVEPVVKKEEKKPASTLSKADDMFDAHNFDIQLDLPFANTDNTITNSILSDLSSELFTKPSLPAPKVENNRRMNLEEYKRKKGLI